MSALGNDSGRITGHSEVLRAVTLTKWTCSRITGHVSYQDPQGFTDKWTTSKSAVDPRTIRHAKAESANSLKVRAQTWRPNN